MLIFIKNKKQKRWENIEDWAVPLKFKLKKKKKVVNGARWHGSGLLTNNMGLEPEKENKAFVTLHRRSKILTSCIHSEAEKISTSPMGL
jgi:aryl-phospho-beta-D-glucosidase BglC (GH1 family)